MHPVFYHNIGRAAERGNALRNIDLRESCIVYYPRGKSLLAYGNSFLLLMAFCSCLGATHLYDPPSQEGKPCLALG